MEIAAGGGNGCMAESSLYEMDGRAAVERMTGMGVTQPVRRDLLGQSGSLRGNVDHPSNLGDVQMTALATAEDRICRGGIPAERLQQIPSLGLEKNRTGLAAFAEDGDLAAIAAREQVTPLQLSQFGDSDTGAVKKTQHDLVASGRRTVDEPGDIAFLENSLRQAAGVRLELHSGADIEREISGFLAEREKRFDRSQGSVLAGGFETSLPQCLCIGLEIRHGDGGERFLDGRAEPGKLGTVGAAGVRAHFGAEPKVDEGLVGFGGGSNCRRQAENGSQSIGFHALNAFYQMMRTE